MANETQLAILKEGVDVWNRWRKENPEVTNPDLSWADLRDANLYWANLNGADLNWANFSDCELVFADFRNSDLTRANLTGANLTKANFSGANLDGATLEGANLTRAVFTEANLNQVNMEKADLEFAELANANLAGAVLTEANLKDADLDGVKLENVALNGANLNKTVLSDSGLEKNEGEGVKRFLRYLIALAALATLVFFFYQRISSQQDVVIYAPIQGPMYVYLNGTPLTPMPDSPEPHNQFLVENCSAGAYELKAYGPLLDDAGAITFTRYKLFQHQFNISGSEQPYNIRVTWDTLYSIKKLAAGTYPGMDPDGEKLVFVKDERILKGEKGAKKLFVLDMKTMSEKEIVLSDRSLYDYDWEWDPPRLSDDGRTIYLSGFDYRTEKVALFRISAKAGKVSEIPLNSKKKWLKYMPLAGRKGVLLENRKIALNGKRQSAFMSELPFQDNLFYAGKNGILFLTDDHIDSSMARHRKMLNVRYYEFGADSSRVLWSMLPSAELPALSATDSAKFVVGSYYKGITQEFFSTIRLWAEGQFVDLTKPFLDGNRKDDKGEYYHKTRITADKSARRIAFDYGGDIYLIEIPESVTMKDFIAADAPAKKK